MYSNQSEIIYGNINLNSFQHYKKKSDIFQKNKTTTILAMSV